MTPEQKELEVQSLEARIAWIKADEGNRPKLQFNSRANLGHEKFEIGWVPWSKEFVMWDSGFFRLARARKLPNEKERASQELPTLLVPLGWPDGTRWEFVNEEWNGEISSEHAYFWPSIGEWFWAKANNTLTTRSFYAKLVSPQTEKEKAEAALNAYKLEPGERLVHRGKEWRAKDVSFLYLNELVEVMRSDNKIAAGAPGYYAEIIKEPELAPKDEKPRFVLQAVHDGFGDSASWGLYVSDSKAGGELVEVPWPDDWPDRVNRKFLEAQGFTCVTA